jgi:hypothetical protein
LTKAVVFISLSDSKTLANSQAFCFFKHTIRGKSMKKFLFYGLVFSFVAGSVCSGMDQRSSQDIITDKIFEAKKANANPLEQERLRKEFFEGNPQDYYELFYAIGITFDEVVLEPGLYYSNIVNSNTENVDAMQHIIYTHFNSTAEKKRANKEKIIKERSETHKEFLAEKLLECRKQSIITINKRIKKLEMIGNCEKELKQAKAFVKKQEEAIQEATITKK